MTTAPTEIGVSSGREDAPCTDARLERALSGAHQLCDVLWEELHEQSSPAYARELAERMADLASTVALLAGAARETTAKAAPVALDSEHVATAPTGSSRARSMARLIDEHDEPASAWWRSSAQRSREGGEANGAAGEHPAWLSMLASALSQFERDHAPFAVLLIEVLGSGEHSDASEQLRRAAELALDGHGRGSLAPESPNRYWLLVPRADAAAATVIAGRLTHPSGELDGEGERSDAADRYFAALTARGSRANADRGPASLRVAVGAAACPQDGRDVSALVAQAHVELAQVRSQGGTFPAETEPSYR